MIRNSPTEQLTWLIEMAEIQRKSSQFPKMHELLNDIESELLKSEGDMDDTLFCEVALYLARNYEELGYVGKSMEYYEQASLFAPEISTVEEKALMKEVRLKAFLGLNEDLEPSYIYLKSFEHHDDFQYLTSVGFSELTFGRMQEAIVYFDRALHLENATQEEKRKLFFQLLEQELFYGHNFSRLVRLSDLTMFEDLTAYEQTLIFALTRDLQAMQFLGPAWFAKMNPVESLKSSFLLSQVKSFRLAWAYKPVFFQGLSQFDFHTQVLWKAFFEKASNVARPTAS